MIRPSVVGGSGVGEAAGIVCGLVAAPGFSPPHRAAAAADRPAYARFVLPSGLFVLLFAPSACVTHTPKS